MMSTPDKNQTAMPDYIAHEPFEWLTNFESLASFLHPDFLFPTKGEDVNTDVHDADNKILSSIKETENFLTALHIGCGSSLLGEMLQYQFPRYRQVVNVDNDVEILVGMKKNWNCRLEKREAVNSEMTEERDFVSKQNAQSQRYTYLNLTQQHNPCMKYPNLDAFQEDPNTHSNFDLILDKSTLDCLLCSYDGAAGLLCTIYSHLNHSGIYFVISFHHVDFILPLLQECPGADWNIQHYTVPRKVDSPLDAKEYESLLDEKIISPFNPDMVRSEEHIEENEDDFSTKSPKTILTPNNVPSAWSSGEFNPDESYRRFVNIFICRKNNDANDDLDGEEVRNHLHQVNDDYFKKENPMVTHVRIEELKKSFHINLQKVACLGKSPKSSKLPIQSCYEILFTDAEREHLSYELFMEDWEEYCNDRQTPKDGMTVGIAVDFLEVMQ